MSSRCRNSGWLVLGALPLLSLLAGCDRERREFSVPPPAEGPPSQTAISPLVGGETNLAYRAQQQRIYGENAYHISQGQQLYGAFNCYGCHAWGGGDIGPPLMDEQWIYGGEIDQVYLSIAQGRPNGMPAFAGLIPPQQMWQIAAYVRSLSGQGSKSARSARSDHMRTPAPQEALPTPPRPAERDES